MPGLTTPDLVELTQRAYEAANRGDVQALLSLFVPDCVYDMSPTGIGTSEGTSAIGQFLEEWWGAYDGIGSRPKRSSTSATGLSSPRSTRAVDPLAAAAPSRSANAASRAGGTG